MAKTKRIIKEVTMFNNNDDNTSTGTTSLLGKFRERLNKIRKERMLRKQKYKDEQDKFIKEKVKEIRKELSTEDNPTKNKIVKRTKHKKGIFPNNQEKIQKQASSKDIKENIKQDQKEKNKNTNNIPDNEQEFINDIKKKIEDSREERNYPRKKGLPEEKRKSTNTTSKETIKSFNNQDKTKNIDKTEQRKKELKQKIIRKIKSNFSKKIAELEVLENQLYNLNEKTNQELEIEKIKDIKKEIESIIKKINNIIKEYNIYNENYDLDNIINLDDSILIDDIISYKHLVDNYNSNRELTKEYKLLNEFKDLYQKLDKIKSLSDEVIDNNRKKLDNLEEKETTKDNTNDSINELNNVVISCNNEINNQNKYLSDLMNKVNKIDKQEYTHLKFNGLSNIINSSLLFISSLSLTKKMPLVPRIFINTLATNHLLKNIYHSMVPKKEIEIKYSAINYDKEIARKINDINFTSHLISDTLITLNNIKSEFLLQYNSQIPGYTDTLNKINTIEDSIINSKYKIDTIKDNLSNSRKKNQEKMLKLENLKKNN